MKKTYKNLFYLTLSAFLCLFLTFSANAQRSGNGGGGGGSRPSGSSGGGGGGGGSRPSGGGSMSSPSPTVSRPSGGGGFTGGSRPSGGAGFTGGSRPAGNVGISRPGSFQGGGVVSQRPQGYAPRQGVSVRGNYGYAPRQGVAGGNYGYSQRQGTALGGNLASSQRQNIGVRGNYGYAPRMGVVPRGGISAGAGYRTAPAIGYGRTGYWGNHGYNYYNRGYYNSYYYPRLGFSCGFLPYGYYPFYWGDYQYFYSEGLYYQYDNSQYTVVEPPIGAEITTLPEKAQSIMINGQQYYELNGVYYQPVTKDDGTVVYQIAGKDGELNTGTNVQGDQQQGPQMGDIVNQLPQDCRKIKVNGTKLWVSPDGVYYQEQNDANGNKTYKIVGLPSDEPTQN